MSQFSESILAEKALKARRERRQALQNFAMLAISVAITMWIIFSQNEKRFEEEERSKIARAAELQAFISEKNCKVVGKRDAGGIFQRSQTGLQCADGVTYWKNN